MTRILPRAPTLAVVTLLATSCTSAAPSPLDAVREESAGPTRALERGGRVEGLLTAVPLTGDAAESSVAFVERHRELFGLDPAYAIEREGTTDLGSSTELVTLRLALHGRPVFGASLRVTVEGGVLRSVFADVPGASPPSAEPGLSATAAAQAVADELGLDAPPSADEVELGYLDLAMAGGGASTPELVWQVEAGYPAMARVHVSASSGVLLLEESLTPTDFEELDRERSIVVVDGRGESDTAAVLVDGNHDALVTSEMTWPGATEEGINTHAWANATFDYYWGVHDLSSYDGLCSEVWVVLNYGSPRPFAFWSSRNEAIYITDGNSHPDTIGHEFTHGVVDHVSLVSPRYRLWSGAIDESLADTFTACHDEDGDRWLYKERPGQDPYRDHRSPRATGHPDRYLDVVLDFRGPCADGCDPGQLCDELFGRCVCVTRDCDHGGVHSNSQVLTHAAYLMAEGGTHASTGVTVPAMGISKLEHLLFASAHQLGENTDFFEWAVMAMQTCHRLVRQERRTPEGPFTTADCASLVEAYHAVDLLEEDPDDDGWPDELDNCDDVFNPGQEGPDGDETGDACQGEPPEEMGRGTLRVEVIGAFSQMEVDESSLEVIDSSTGEVVYSTTEDRFGASTIDVVAGAYTVRASAVGFEPASTDVTVAVDATVDVRLELEFVTYEEFVGVFEGYVGHNPTGFFEDRTPIAGATAQLTDPRTMAVVATTSTDAEGNFSVGFTAPLRAEDLDAETMQTWEAPYIVTIEHPEFATYGQMSRATVRRSRLDAGEATIVAQSQDEMYPRNDHCSSDLDAFELLETDFGFELGAVTADDPIGTERYGESMADLCLSGDPVRPTIDADPTSFASDRTIEVLDDATGTELYQGFGMPPFVYGEEDPAGTADLAADGTVYRVEVVGARPSVDRLRFRLR